MQRDIPGRGRFPFAKGDVPSKIQRLRAIIPLEPIMTFIQVGLPYPGFGSSTTALPPPYPRVVTKILAEGAQKPRSQLVI